MYRIIVRKNYVSGNKEYEPGEFLVDENGKTLEFDSGEEALNHAREHEGEHIVFDGVLDWWKDVDI